jgi:hypothetical protein
MFLIAETFWAVLAKAVLVGREQFLMRTMD